MDLWMKIGSAILLVTMLVIIFPQAKRMMKESPKGSASDWMSALIPIGLVVVFIIFLILIV
jgi:archaellum biogenesis protein FlaJ (TadC family)